MNKNMKLLTILFCLGLGVVIIVAGILSGGKHITLILPVGCGMIIAGPTTILAYKNSKKFERECDERENNITEKAMKFTFYFMVFVLTAFWAYDTSGSGTFLRLSSLIYILMWGSFLGSYVVNKLRF